MIILIPGTTGQVDLEKTASGVTITPKGDFDYDDERSVAGLSAIASMVQNGMLVVPHEKMAVISIPGGQVDQQLETQPQKPGQDIPQLVTTEQLQQMIQPLQQEISQLKSMMDNMTGGGQPQAAPQAAPQPQMAPQPQPAPMQPQQPAPGAPALLA